MAVAIEVPDLGTPRGVLSLWYARPGERVFAGDRVLELLVPGATVDVSAPATGVVRERLALPGDAVTGGQIVGSIDPDPDDA